MRRPKQDRLLLQHQAGFVVFEDSLHDKSRPILFITDPDELRQIASGAVRPEAFRVSLAR